MFDLNLIKKPGIQTKSTPREKYLNQNNNKKKAIVKNDVVNNKKQYKISWVGLILASFILFFIYMFFLAGNSRQLLFEKTYRVNMDSVFKVLNEEYPSIIIEKLNYNDKEFEIKIKTLNKKSFYNIINKMSIPFDMNVKGSHLNNLYSVNVKLSKKNNNKSKLKVDELSKELSDLSLDIKKEIYKDKLIIVADKSNLFTLVNLLNKLNLLNSYNINIELIKNISSNLELYQVIID